VCFEVRLIYLSRLIEYRLFVCFDDDQGFCEAWMAIFIRHDSDWSYCVWVDRFFTRDIFMNVVVRGVER